MHSINGKKKRRPAGGRVGAGDGGRENHRLNEYSTNGRRVQPVRSVADLVTVAGARSVAAIQRGDVDQASRHFRLWSALAGGAP